MHGGTPRLGAVAAARPLVAWQHDQHFSEMTRNSLLVAVIAGAVVDVQHFADPSSYLRLLMLRGAGAKHGPWLRAGRLAPPRTCSEYPSSLGKCEPWVSKPFVLVLSAMGQRPVLAPRV